MARRRKRDWLPEALFLLLLLGGSTLYVVVRFWPDQWW